MADFGFKATTLSEPQGQGARPVDPVQTRIDITSPFEALAKAGQALFAPQGEDPIPEFRKKLNAIHQFAVTTGKYGEADIKRRALYDEYQAAFTGHRKALSETFESATKGGLGNLVDQQIKEQQDIHMTNVKNAQNNGWLIAPDAPRPLVDRIVAANANEVQNRKATEDFYKRMEYERSQGRFNAEMEDREAKRLVARLLPTAIETNLDALDAQVELLMSKVTDAQSFASGSMAVNRLVADMKGKLLTAAGTDQALAGPYVTMLEQYRDAALQALDPAKRAGDDAKRLDDQLKALKAKIQMAVLSGSASARAAFAASTLFTNNVAAQLQGSQAAADTFNILTTNDLGLGTPQTTPPVAGNPEIEKQVLGALNQSIKDLNNGTIPANLQVKAAEQINMGVNNFIRDAARQFRENPSPEKLKRTVEFLASPEMATFLQKGKLEPQVAVQLADIVAAGTAGPLRSTISKMEYESVVVGSNGGRPTIGAGKITKVVDGIKDIEFNGAGVVIKGDMTSTSFNKKALEIQNALGVQVRAMAHLEGHADYKKTWEEIRHKLLPDLYAAPRALKIGETVKVGDKTMEYIGGPDARKSSWREVSKPAAE